LECGSLLPLWSSEFSVPGSQLAGNCEKWRQKIMGEGVFYNLPQQLELEMAELEKRIQDAISGRRDRILS
jgi:hypothetical protein